MQLWKDAEVALIPLLVKHAVHLPTCLALASTVHMSACGLSIATRCQQLACMKPTMLCVRWLLTRARPREQRFWRLP